MASTLLFYAFLRNLRKFLLKNPLLRKYLHFLLEILQIINYKRKILSMENIPTICTTSHKFNMKNNLLQILQKCVSMKLTYIFRKKINWEELDLRIFQLLSHYINTKKIIFSEAYALKIFGIETIHIWNWYRFSNLNFLNLNLWKLLLINFRWAFVVLDLVWLVAWKWISVEIDFMNI